MDENQLDSIYNIDDDELIRLVSSSSDSANQFVIFKSGSGRFYAINVAKVEELLVYKTIQIAENSDPKALAKGIAKVRNHMIPIVNFDQWLNEPLKAEEDYELVVLCHYGHCRFGIVIQSVVGIYNISATDLVDHSHRDPKASYVTEVTLNNKKELCIIFDSEKLLAELFPELQGQHDADLKTIETSSIKTKGTLLIAEDSKLIQKKLIQLLEKMELDILVFPDGKQCWDWLNKHSADEVSLIISDVEMPVMDGITLLKNCKTHPSYKHIPLLIHTNMANPAIIKSAQQLGADAVIKKIDFQTLQKTILAHIRQ